MIAGQLPTFKKCTCHGAIEVRGGDELHYCLTCGGMMMDAMARLIRILETNQDAAIFIGANDYAELCRHYESGLDPSFNSIVEGRKISVYGDMPDGQLAVVDVDHRDFLVFPPNGVECVPEGL